MRLRGLDSIECAVPLGVVIRGVHKADLGVAVGEHGCAVGWNSELVRRGCRAGAECQVSRLDLRGSSSSGEGHRGGDDEKRGNLHGSEIV